MMNRVVVFAGNDCVREKEEFYFRLAYETGKLLAKEGLVTVSGGGPGLMNEVMRGAFENGGKTIAICLKVSGRKFTEFATEKEVFHILNERQNRLIGLGDAYLALPGGIGTFYEIAAVLALKRKMEISREQPLILLGDYFDEFERMVDKMKSEGFVTENFKTFYRRAEYPEEAVRMLREGLAKI